MDYGESEVDEGGCSMVCWGGMLGVGVSGMGASADFCTCSEYNAIAYPGWALVAGDGLVEVVCWGVW